MRITGQTQQKVSQAKRKLIEKRIVTENGNKISINKDYDSWVRVTENGNNSYRKRQQKLPKTVNTKDNIKTITKDTSEEGSSQVDKIDAVSKYNPLGAEVIKALETVDPKNKTYYGNTTQRKACDFLIEEYGLEEVKNRILVVEKTNGVPFFPTITTAAQLRDKWVQLEKAIERHKREAGVDKVAF